MIARFHSHKGAVGILLVGLGGVFVLIRAHQLPAVVLEPFILLHGLLNGHDLHALRGLVAAMAYLVVYEHYGPVALMLFGGGYAHRLHSLLYVLGSVFELVYDLLLPYDPVLVQIDIRSVLSLLVEGFLYGSFTILHDMHSL
ncbi:hypothetical protein SDC9_200510 [bioreactor metagenome]|uniref:Uncharacterized protein n=1 Tax=bioreactor metagenome TaxID=1076179 RepID=A0A645INM9_9ZZZZ